MTYIKYHVNDLYRKLYHIFFIDSTDHGHIIHYPHGNRWYKMFIPKRRTGPLGVMAVMDHSGDDILDHLIPFMGPHGDFHGQHVTPRHFGYKKISIMTIHGETHHFNEDDHLKITNSMEA